MNLYHYTTGQGLRGILNSSELRCSNVNFLNDPSEESYFIELLEEVFSKSAEVKNIYHTLFSKSFQTAIVDPLDRFVASFSKNQDSLSMWNHYAKGNGYNIELDIEKIIENNNGNNISIQKVELVYDKSSQLKNINDYILGFKEDCTRYLELKKQINNAKTEEEQNEYGHEQMCIIEDFNQGIFKLRLIFKHQAYEREEEVRLIISENEIEQNTSKFRVSENGVFIEFIPLRLNLTNELKSITIHPLCGELHLRGIKKFINSKIKRSKSQINVEEDIKISKIPFRIV